MDFRQVSVRDLAWRKTPRGASCLLREGGKVTVQTPVVACTVTRMQSKFAMGWTLELLMPETDQLRSEFAGFLQAVGDSAAAWGGMGAEPPLNLGSFRGNRTLRVTAFSDTLVFDAAGGVTDDPSRAKACSCLLELQGAWTSPARWGVRWKVVQVKLSDDPAPRATAAPARQPFGFADEDDDADTTGAASKKPQFDFIEDV